MTKTPANRWKNHRDGANSGYKSPLSAALRKYGINNVKFELMVMGEQQYISDLENATIKKFKTQDRKYGYNIRDGGLKGNKFGEESCKKISEYNNRPEVKAKLIERNKAKKGQKWSLESIEKWKSSEKVKNFVPWNKGSPCTEEMKERLSKKLTGQKFSEERKAGLKGRATSEETKKKIAAKHLGKKRNKEARENIRLGALNRKKYDESFGRTQSFLKKHWWANATPEMIEARSNKMRATKNKNKQNKIQEISPLMLCGGEDSPNAQHNVI